MILGMLDVPGYVFETKTGEQQKNSQYREGPGPGPICAHIEEGNE